VGATMCQTVGAVSPWPNQQDEGRSADTTGSADRMVFKVPSLKNIAETAPYFHDGSATDLETAIRRMGHHQLGIDLDDGDVKAIAAWMRSMTGEIDSAYIAAPTLPGSAPTTVKTL
jgi:cytochrome c peroxidase